jgi:hypothetical protein
MPSLRLPCAFLTPSLRLPYAFLTPSLRLPYASHTFLTSELDLEAGTTLRCAIKSYSRVGSVCGLVGFIPYAFPFRLSSQKPVAQGHPRKHFPKQCEGDALTHDNFSRFRLGPDAGSQP